MFATSKRYNEVKFRQLSMETRKYNLQIRQYITTEFKSKFLKNDNSIEFKKLTNEPKFNLNKQVHSSKNITMWENYGLLKDNRQFKNENNLISGWKKHSFSQYVWIKIISKLKKFGLNNNHIMDIKTKLTENEDQSNICEFGLLDFFIKQIVINDAIAFLLSDERGRSVLINKEDMLAVESQLGFEHGDMIKISLSKIVKELMEEVNIQFGTE
tara:strand:- start:86 stop:724 length:639 start_codon:yes stop_codon:yes gene_type:complete